MKIKDININYKKTGDGPPIILLHGWGCELSIFNNLAHQLEEDFTIYQIDLPGFGKSEICDSYSLDTYSEIIREFVLIEQIEKPTILGHSFGGRVAIKYASKYEVEKLVLVATPGIKEKYNIIKESKIFFYKLCKKFKIKLNLGSTDYKKASNLLKGVLVKAVNEDLTDDIRKINIPTLLIYGKKDKIVPLYVGQKINKLIQNSGIVVMKDTKHYPFIERFRYFYIVLKYFLCSDIE